MLFSSDVTVLAFICGIRYDSCICLFIHTLNEIMVQTCTAHFLIVQTVLFHSTVFMPRVASNSKLQVVSDFIALLLPKGSVGNQT
jgi:hypothetical protein